MRKTLVTMIEGPLHEEMATLTMPTFERYAERHNYDIWVGRPGDAPSIKWAKPYLLREAINESDFAFWVDIDAAFSADAPDVTQHLVDSHAFQALTWLNYVHNGLEPDHMADSGFVPTLLSTGIWLVQQHPFAARFFDTLFDQEDLFDSEYHEAAGVWRLLGAHDGSAQMIADNRWLAFPTGTILLNDRWNSRWSHNAPHIFHSTWLGAAAQPDLRLALLQQFITEGALADDLLNAREAPKDGA